MISLYLLIYLLILPYIISEYNVIVLNKINRDNNCFTQGLVIYNHYIYESCGLYKRSSIKKIDLNTYTLIKSYNLPSDVFIEGITIVDELLYALTWKNYKIFVLSVDTLELVKTFSYSNEGWGITNDLNGYLYTSDGSNKIFVYDKQFELVKDIYVIDKSSNKSISHINELEFINGSIYANVWLHDIIIKIDPFTGLADRIDMKRLLYPRSKRRSTDECLNGIAYNHEINSFLLTGKLWPYYYNIHIQDSNQYDSIKRELT